MSAATERPQAPVRRLAPKRRRLAGARLPGEGVCNRVCQWPRPPQAPICAQARRARSVARPLSLLVGPRRFRHPHRAALPASWSLHRSGPPPLGGGRRPQPYSPPREPGRLHDRGPGRPLPPDQLCELRARRRGHAELLPLECLAQLGVRRRGDDRGVQALDGRRRRARREIEPEPVLPGHVTQAHLREGGDVREGGQPLGRGDAELRTWPAR